MANKITCKKKMALLIAAHNEELVLEKTIRSAIDAGMKPEYIYVIDDNSTDYTSRIARSILPRNNVSKVRRSGKGLALTKAVKKFGLTDKFQWIHIADADCAFAPNYFSVMRKTVRVKNVAATGYVRSLPGKNVSQYRVFEYTIGMEFHRRFQSLFNVISIIPGPTSCFRSDIFNRLDFHVGTLTEDFDVTLQIHRLKLGNIQFIPDAYVYTQDPKTVADFTKQVTRWNRGTMQGIIRHKIGLKPKGIDAYLSFQIFQNMLLLVNYFVWIPYHTVTSKEGGIDYLAAIFLVDVLLAFSLSVFAAMRSGRYDILSAFPYIYLLRWLNVVIFFKAFIEVVVMRRHRISNGIWSTGARRYVS